MRNFSQLITEIKKDYNVEGCTPAEVQSYINKVKNIIPDDVKRAIFLTQSMNLLSAEQLDKVRESKKPELKKYVDELHCSLEQLQELWQFFKEMKGNYKLLPQYISKSERELITNGKMDPMDVLIDTETKQGREMIVKQFAPLITTIVNKYENVSWMDRSDLISACHEYLVDAMNKYQKGPNAKTGKASSFRAFVKAHILQELKNELSKHGRTLSGGSWYTNDMKELDATRMDALVGKDGEINPEHWDALGVEDAPVETKEAKTLWNKIYSVLSKKFSERDMDIFMSFYGLGGRQPMSGKELAKKYNRTYELIMDKKGGPIAKIMKFLRENPRMMELLQALRDMYTECLLCSLSGSRDDVYEQILSDDAYMLLEAAARWSSKQKFMSTFNNAISKSSQQILDIIGGDFITLDSNLKKLHKEYVVFLKNMYPTENFANLRDMDVLELMSEVQQYYHKYNK